MENIENTGPQPEAAGEAPANPEAGRGFIARTTEKITTALREYMELPLVEKVKNISMNALGAVCAYAGIKILGSAGLGDVNKDLVLTALPAGLFGVAYLQQKLSRATERDIAAWRKATRGER